VYAKGLSDSDWRQLGNNKAAWISASNDALWIRDYDSDLTFQYDELTG
jgi:hypothetical protein